MKSSSIYLIIGFLFFAVSCSDSKDYISEGTIEDAVNELLKQNKYDQFYTNIKTGYYECNNEGTRVILAKLAAAGVIEYNVERYAWWNKHLYAGNSYGYYYGGENYYFESHFMVNVKLTSLGEDLCVDSIPQPEPVVDEDMSYEPIDAKKLPESGYKKESWPEIPCPVKENAEVPEEEQSAETMETEEMARPVNLNDIFQEEPVEIHRSNNEEVLPMDVITKTRYDAALEKVNQKDVIVKASRLTVKDVRYIQTFKDPNSGLDFATAEVILEMTDATSAGRIIDGYNEGEKFCASARLIYYQDKGWVLPNMSLDISRESSAIPTMLKQIESVKNSQRSTEKAMDFINSMKDDGRNSSTETDDYESDYYGYEY